MSWDIVWYQSYRDSEPPYLRRLNRESDNDQLIATIDLATEFCCGRAGYAAFSRSIKIGPMTIMEDYWYWRPKIKFRADIATIERFNGRSFDEVAAAAGYKTRGAARAAVKAIEQWNGWWLIPHRVTKRAFLLVKAATDAECRANNGTCTHVEIERRLNSWRRSGKFRRIMTRDLKPLDEESRMRFYQWCQKFYGDPKPKRRKRAR